MPPYYGVITFRQTFVKPGNCPFCVADERQPSLHIRLETRRRPIDLMDHIQKDHISLTDLNYSKKTTCPHSECIAHIVSAKEMILQLANYHGTLEPHSNGRALKPAFAGGQ